MRAKYSRSVVRGSPVAIVTPGRRVRDRGAGRARFRTRANEAHGDQPPRDGLGGVIENFSTFFLQVSELNGLRNFDRQNAARDVTNLELLKPLSAHGRMVTTNMRNTSLPDP